MGLSGMVKMIKNNHQFAWIYQAYTVPLLYKR